MWSQLASGDARILDLSISIEADVESEPWPPEINYEDHEDGAETLAATLRQQGFDVDAEDFPGGLGLAAEFLTATPHTATHMDAPWHYGPEVDGDPAKTIDEVPLSWGIGNAVVLDFTWKEPRSEISAEEIEVQLEELDHELSAGEIVLVQTGADELWGTHEYLTEYPGMSAEGTKFLVEQGVKVVGTDAYGFDKPFVEMGRRFEETGDSDELWPAHFAGREVEYCQIEKMANLDALPRRTEIPLLAIPVSIENGSGGWVRPIAVIEEP
ncbi:cyclase family protein [Halopelagius longus]|uniref:Cyclase family protein n=1 Tax=Halopelagius longus TaxID=1236180 RepID=A0A1H1FZW9_9EURY|nr:cyclase family protein [Halopelagius longus]RDI69929.1 cyclase family protein [Halopelagius longus]SDR06471.1 Kynurenine formamidase [Halopelagius longus]